MIEMTPAFNLPPNSLLPIVCCADDNDVPHKILRHSSGFGHLIPVEGGRIKRVVASFPDDANWKVSEDRVFVAENDPDEISMFQENGFFEVAPKLLGSAEVPDEHVVMMRQELVKIPRGMFREAASGEQVAEAPDKQDQSDTKPAASAAWTGSTALPKAVTDSFSPGRKKKDK